MNKTSIIWVLISFVAYLAMMLVIGAKFMKKNKSSEDYFLGGRNLGGWVAALSAQASDMSGWLLMGLPGAIYAGGTGQAWIAVGLFIGTVLNWIFVSSRLRRYTIKAKNSLTLPEYFQNRFHDKTKILITISSVIIVIFFLVYTASALAAGGKLFTVVFGIDYKIALTIGEVVILAYTFMGGFMAVCVTDFIQGFLMITALMIIPFVSFIIIGGTDNVVQLLGDSGVTGGASSFLNIMQSDGKNLGFIDIISQIGWGLGYCGMPHILTRFMAIRSETELKKSRVIAIVWVAISLIFASIIGILGRAYLYPTILGGIGESSTENVFIEMIKKLFMGDFTLPFIGGIFLCGILAAIMSTADSQLLVTASSVSQDLYKGVIKKDASEKKVLLVSRITVMVIAIIAYIIALNPDSSIMGLVSNAWAGFGAAFGPTVILSLYWKRSNLPGAAASMISGGLTVLVWEYIPIISGQTLSAATGLYSLIVGFAIATVMMIVVSLLTKEPSEEMMREFDEAVGK